MKKKIRNECVIKKNNKQWYRLGHYFGYVTDGL